LVKFLYLVRILKFKISEYFNLRVIKYYVDAKETKTQKTAKR